MNRLLIAMAGLPASGKSALAVRLQATLDSARLDKDELRAFLFGAQVDYTREQDDLVIGFCYDTAIYRLRRHPGQPVILDGRTYSRRYQIKALHTAVERAAAELCLIECVCSEKTARARLQADAGRHLAADRDIALYQRSRAEAEAITQPHLTIDTDLHDPAEAEALALRYIAGLVG